MTVYRKIVEETYKEIKMVVQKQIFIQWLDTKYQQKIHRKDSHAAVNRKLGSQKWEECVGLLIS